MANTASLCTSFLSELMTGTHNFGVSPIRAATTADTFKGALYLASATYNAATTAYSATGEVSGTNYTAGGVSVTNANSPAFHKHFCYSGHGLLDAFCVFVLHKRDFDYGV
jgi:hypothetical protein